MGQYEYEKLALFVQTLYVKYIIIPLKECFWIQLAIKHTVYLDDEKYKFISMKYLF